MINRTEWVPEQEGEKERAREMPKACTTAIYGQIKEIILPKSVRTYIKGGPGTYAFYILTELKAFTYLIFAHMQACSVPYFELYIWLYLLLNMAKSLRNIHKQWETHRRRSAGGERARERIADFEENYERKAEMGRNQPTPKMFSHAKSQKHSPWLILQCRDACTVHIGTHNADTYVCQHKTNG